MPHNYTERLDLRKEECFDAGYFLWYCDENYRNVRSLFSFLETIDYVSILIQFTGSIALYYNKRHVRDQTPSGWLLGIIGLIIISIPVFQNKFYVTFVLHMGMIVLSLYGYAVAVKFLDKYSKRFDILLRLLVVILTVSMALYVAYEYRSMKNFNGLQLAHALTGLSGALFLALNTRQTRLIGWISYAFSHVMFCIYIFPRGLYIIIFFQLLSVFVAWDGIKLNMPDKNKKAPA